jgi:hypothetical protein
LRVEPLEERCTPAVAFALSGTNLLAFDTANPTAVTTTAISPLMNSETLVGIDFRPQNGFLYGLGVNAMTDTATLYSISTRTGVATAIGTPGQITFVDSMMMTVDLPDPAMQGYGVDFNPVADRVRVVAGSLNFRVNPNTGAPIDGNAGIAGNQTDASLTVMGMAALSDGAAYTNNVQSTIAAPQTTQYVLDAATNELRIQNPPNAGTQTTVATVTLNGMMLDFDDVNGFDIPAGVNAPTSNMPVTTGSAFAILTVSGTTGLYSIDLVTGAATMLGTVGTGTNPVSGLAVQNDVGGSPSIGLSADGTMLVRFNTATPGTSVSVTISGVTMGETLVAIDYRPATGQLFGLGINATMNTGTLYVLDPQSGVATAVGTPSGIAFVQGDGTTAVDFPDPAMAGYGFDFNPTVDRIRVVTSTGLNFRLRPDTGAAVDGNLNTGLNITGVNTDANITGGGITGASATAYTNSFGQSLMGGVTSQYTLDAATNSLAIANPPNSGAQTSIKTVTLNGATLDFTDVSGFDISGGVRVTTSGTVASGFGTAVLTVNSVSSLYRIDLSTGAATLIGAAPVALNGLATGDTPAGTIAFGGATFSADEGGTLNLTFTRTGGSTGVVTATVTVTGGTATAGTDFTAGPFTVTFADGATTATVAVPIQGDTTQEGPETITFALSMATGALLGTQTTATATIADVDARAFGTVISSPNSPSVTVLNTDGTVLGTFAPLPGATGVRTAFGDITGDGVDDLFMSATNSPTVAIFNGATGALIASGQAFDSSFGSASVAVGDFTGDGTADLLIASSVGGLVRVIDGATGALLVNTQPVAGFTGGFNVAAGDFTGDGLDELVLGTTTGSGRVLIFSPTTGLLVDTIAVAGTGVAVAMGDLDGDGRDDFIFGTLSGTPSVRVVRSNGTSATFGVHSATSPLSVTAGGAGGRGGNGGAGGRGGDWAGVPSATSPLSVTAVDVDRDGLADVVIGSGSGGSVFAFAGDDLAFLGTSNFGFNSVFVG